MRTVILLFVVKRVSVLNKLEMSNHGIFNKKQIKWYHNILLIIEMDYPPNFGTIEVKLSDDILITIYVPGFTRNDTNNIWRNAISNPLIFLKPKS